MKSLKAFINNLQGFGRPSQTEARSSQKAAPGLAAPTIENQLSMFSSNMVNQESTQQESSHDQGEDNGPPQEDPLPGMPDHERYGLKGMLAMLKGPYPDQTALLTGVDITSLGLDLGSSEPLSQSIWSPWDDLPARPDVPQYTLPECYQVHNVQVIENKLSNFTDETLMFMFYNNPQDIQQIVAAQELANRNWRYHKKIQLWLTKDDMMMPQQLGGGSERGYYIFFDPKVWARERVSPQLVALSGDETDHYS
jgi:CCR4-NOT transcription complex subunit 2